MTIAIDGISSLLGQAIAAQLQQSELSSHELIAILHGDVADLADTDLPDRSEEFSCREQFFEHINFAELDIVFIADLHVDSEKTLATAVASGAMVIDCVGLSANHGDVPLIAFAINSQLLQGLMPGFVIATPSPDATMLCQVVAPLREVYGDLEKINVCHFLPASHFGKAGVELLAGQTARLLNGMPLNKKQSPAQVAFNLIPQCGALNDSGYCEWEVTLKEQTRRLLDDPVLQVNVTCIQVPVFYAQCQTIELTFTTAVDPQQAEQRLKQVDGIRVAALKQSTPAIVQAQSDHSDIVVSRVRQNPGEERSLTYWCVSDNLRVGAAGNAVQIADLLIKSYL